MMKYNKTHKIIRLLEPPKEYCAVKALKTIYSNF